MVENDFHRLGEAPYMIAVSATDGALLCYRELGSAECDEPMRYAENEARGRRGGVICVVVQSDGTVHSAYAKA